MKCLLNIRMILVGMLLLAVSAHAQQFGSLNYSLSFPTGDTRDYINNTSFAGVGLDGRRFVRPNVSVGLILSWNALYERTNRLIVLESGHVSGNQLRHINAFPIMVSGHVYLGRQHGFHPYVGANAGTYYITRRLDVGIFRFDRDHFHWGLAPEVGFLLDTGESGLTFSLRYNYAFAAGGSIDFSYWILNIGFNVTEYIF